jgi:DNA-binding transcriptional ArsR family regulator
VPQESESQFSTELAATLAPHLKRALDNPIRRRILRALDSSDEAYTLEGLSKMLPGISLSTISFHVRTLEECGTVSARVPLPATERGRSGNRYVSSIGDDQGVREVLSHTRRDDEPDK